MKIDILQPIDIDVSIAFPTGLLRTVEQNLVDLTPWQITPRNLARKRLKGLRLRYRTKYVPIAHRQDNDDLAVVVPDRPDHVIVIHDFAEEGSEIVGEFSSFWSWFRSAIDDMIAFE
jgi:hypothetical protein